VKYKTLLVRSATGALYVAMVVFSIALGPWWFAALMFIFFLLSLLEYLHLVLPSKEKILKCLTIIVSSGLYCILCFTALNPLLQTEKLLAWSILLIPILLTFSLFIKSSDILMKIALVLLGIIYITFPFVLLNFIGNPWLTKFDDPRIILLSFFIFVWTNDTFAYLMGVNFGRHRLFERLSPAKTWEGMLGGIFFTLVMGILLSCFFKELSFIQWIGMALITSVSGILGDLSESLIKRTFGVKDSGKAIPGHGGFLDRFDSILFATPSIFVYFIMISLITL